MTPEGEHDPIVPEAPAPALPDPAPISPLHHSKRDPWAHRRAEPRTFAFIWTVFLFFATMSTYVVAMSTNMATQEVVRASARMLLAVIASGVLIVWPMVRLSQPPDPRPILGPVLDITVLIVPVQAIVWPQVLPWLSQWTAPVVVAISASLFAWSLLIGAVISMSHSLRRRSPSTPTLWMIVFVLILFGGLLPLLWSPAPTAFDQPSAQARTAWMASPITSMLELAADRTFSSTPVAVFPSHFRAIGIVACIGLCAWIAALVVRNQTGRRAHPGLN